MKNKFETPYLNNQSETIEKSEKIKNLEILSSFLRRDALETIIAANSGHIGGSLSSLELLTAMYFGGMFKFDVNDSKNPNRDKILIRGHEGPIRYSIFSLLEYIKRDELSTYRQLGSRLQGHEDMHLMPGVDITPSGSLGMLLSYGVGSAIESKNKGQKNKIIVFLGDGEEQEGNISEAARHGASLGLDNLICIIDKNGKQLSRPTAESDPNSDLETIWRGYGWNVEVIKNGHDISEILDVYKKLQNIEKPTFVIANTIKGYGVDGSEEHFSGYHTLSAVPDKEVVNKAISELTKDLESKEVTVESATKMARSYVTSPEETTRVEAKDTKHIFNIKHNGESGKNLEEGQANFFSELKKRILSNPVETSFYIITPDLLRKDIVMKEGMDKYARFIDTGIREQHAIAMAHGISVENPESRIYVCYGDAFLYRAMDQINAAAQGKSNILISGENAGIFQGQNGKTHQSIGQTGALLHMPDIKVYEPSDVVDLYNVYSKALTENEGLSYVRLHRGKVKLERNDSDKESTDAYYVHKPDTAPKFTIIASGFMLENAVEAAKKMEVNYRIPTAVINVVNQKSLSRSLPSLLQTSTPILTVYNGNPNILKNSVSGAILENPDIPKPQFVTGHGFMEGTSGPVNDLIKFYKLDRDGIVDIAMNTIKKNK